MARLDPAGLRDAAEGLADLLVDTVRGGASLGFLAGLDRAAAAAWWRGLAPALADGRLAVWALTDDQGEGGRRVTGTVGLAFEDKPNGRHRAEITKLMVHRSARGKGHARALLAAAEQAAVRAGVTLLVLDTETGSPAQALYRSAGWAEAGSIPDYAADPAGVLHATTLYYKRLGAGRADAGPRGVPAQ
ncbi:GNAT family N-acetyltransferase [Streptomyces sp. NPDC047123]|uniref:GNAT family N-acetyltransferase n=1 Tax=Streptomyces sp. NPDC047123 TaxID=3155622 RepID=UPI0033ED46D8